MTTAVIKVKKSVKPSSTSKQALKTQAESLSQPKSPIIVEKAFNRSDLIQTLSDQVAITKKEAAAVLDTLKEIMVAHLVQGGPQHFKWPGLLNMKVKTKAATQARQGINPLTGQPTTFAAKPAKRLVKITALHGLKESI